MSDLVIIALIAAIVGILTAGSTLLGIHLSQRNDSKRRFADYFLAKRIDALNDLHAALIDAYFTLSFYGNTPPSTFDEYRDRVLPEEHTYVRSKVVASIYLGEEGNRIMNDALGAFRQASMAIYLSLPDSERRTTNDSYDPHTREIDWKRLSTSYEGAIAYLRPLLSPEAIQFIKQPN